MLCAAPRISRLKKKVEVSTIIVDKNFDLIDKNC